MKQSKMEKVIAKAIEAGTEEAPAAINAILITLITEGCDATKGLNAIKKAFKAAGLIASTSISSLAKVREYLASSMPDMNTYHDMRIHAEAMQSKFEINGDDDKGTNSAIKLIKAQLKEDSLPVPKKVHLGVIKETIVEYFNNAEEDDELSVEELGDYLVENVEGSGTKEFEAKLRVSAGTNFSAMYMVKYALNLDEIN